MRWLMKFHSRLIASHKRFNIDTDPRWTAGWGIHFSVYSSLSWATSERVRRMLQNLTLKFGRMPAGISLRLNWRFIVCENGLNDEKNNNIYNRTTIRFVWRLNREIQHQNSSNNVNSTKQYSAKSLCRLNLGHRVCECSHIPGKIKVWPREISKHAFWYAQSVAFTRMKLSQ